MSKLYVNEMNSKTSGQDLVIKNGTNTALTIDSNGRVFKPQKIAFMSKLASNFNPGTAARTVVPFATNNSADRVFNYGNGFDSANNRFVAPVAGLYLVFALARIDSHSTSSYHILRFAINGSVIGEGYAIIVPNSGSYQSTYVQCYVNLSVGDYVDCRTQSQSDTSYNIEVGSSHFSGHFIG